MVKVRTGNQNDIQNITELLIDTWQTCYRGLMPDDFLEKLSLEKQIERHTKYFQRGIQYFIAESESKALVGFASFGKNRMDPIHCEKELYTLYVDKNYQGKGIGKMLLHAVLTDLEKKDNVIAVSVFQNNPFKRFYTKNGFVKIGTEKIDMGDFELIGEIFSK